MATEVSAGREAVKVSETRQHLIETVKSYCREDSIGFNIDLFLVTSIYRWMMWSGG